MRLEGNDPIHMHLICILNVAQVIGNRLRLNFDGFDHSYDFWRNIDSKFIYPVGYCKKHNLVLTPPNGSSFNYLNRSIEIVYNYIMINF